MKVGDMVTAAHISYSWKFEYWGMQPELFVKGVPFYRIVSMDTNFVGIKCPEYKSYDPDHTESYREGIRPNFPVAIFRVITPEELEWANFPDKLEGLLSSKEGT